MARLQKVQNNAARLVMRKSKREHTTPLLKQLQCIRVDLDNENRLLKISRIFYIIKLYHFTFTEVGTNCFLVSKHFQKCSLASALVYVTLFLELKLCLSCKTRPHTCDVKSHGAAGIPVLAARDHNS